MKRHPLSLILLIGFLLAHPHASAERLILASASYGKNLVAICDANGKVLWSHPTAGPQTGHAGHHDIQFLDNDNILFHENWTTVLEMTLDKKVVWKYDAATKNGNQGKRVEVHAFRRLPSGLTMIAENHRSRPGGQGPCRGESAGGRAATHPYGSETVHWKLPRLR